ncbi:MAG: hypothetical protein RSA40_02160 [Malacoplasma sp.]
MSYYRDNKKINGIYSITNHALVRAKKRISSFKNLPDTDVIFFIGEIIDNAVEDLIFNSFNDYCLFNYEHRIQFILTSDNVIKTIIKK